MQSAASKIAFILGLLLIPFAASAAEEPVPRANRRYVNDQGNPKYEAWINDYFDELFRVSDTTAFKAQKHKFSGHYILSHLRLWQVTKNERYLKEALVQFDALMSFAPGNKDILHDCFGLFPVVLSGYLLKSEGVFDPAHERAFFECVAFGMKHLEQQRDYTDGNQDLARLSAIACAVRIYPAKFASFRPLLDRTWEQIIKTGDLWLDSKTYTPVSVLYLCALADMLDRTRDIAQSPRFRRMFGNFRDVLSPNGFMPEFGHAYFEPPGQPEWLYVFEWAAALYNDPTFSYAAHKFFNQLVRQGPPTFGSGNEARLKCHYALIGLMPPDRTEILLSQWQKCAQPATAPQLVSGITQRGVAGQGDKDAFLILRPSLEPGAPMMMMNLLSWGDHALFDQRASIGYYETGHVPHFYQYGRYAQAASRGNVVLLAEPTDAFPDDGWPANTWRTLKVPLERFDGTGGTRTVDRISLRMFGKQGIQNQQALYIDNIRLSGPKGEKILFDFENTIGWRGKGLSLVDNASSGKQALKINIVEDSVGAPALGLTVNLKEFTTFSMDVKWTGKERPRVQLRPSEANTAWTQVKDMPLIAEVKAASVQTQGKDSLARIEFSPYGTHDSRLIRRIILTEEGVLFVHDELTVGPSANPAVAGMLWQMYSMDKRGENWFSTEGERGFRSAQLDDTKEYRAGFLAWFPKRPGVDIDLIEVAGGKGHGPTYKNLQRDSTWRAAYTRQAVQTGKPIVFDLVVVPHAPGLIPDALARGISIEQAKEKTVFRIRSDGLRLEAVLDERDQWRVLRN